MPNSGARDNHHTGVKPVVLVLFSRPPVGERLPTDDRAPPEQTF